MRPRVFFFVLFFKLNVPIHVSNVNFLWGLLLGVKHFPFCLTSAKTLRSLFCPLC